jgi:hypothetical protein
MPSAVTIARWPNQLSARGRSTRIGAWALLATHQSYLFLLRADFEKNRKGLFELIEITNYIYTPPANFIANVPESCLPNSFGNFCNDTWLNYEFCFPIVISFY